MSVPTLHTLDRVWGGGDEPFVTIRKAGKYEGTEGQVYDLCQCKDGNHSDVGEAVVLNTANFLLRALPARILSWHYNKECQSYDGLMTALEKAYPGIADESEITVLRLRRVQPEESAA